MKINKRFLLLSSSKFVCITGKGLLNIQG